jgi:hypothetical protein
MQLPRSFIAGTTRTYPYTSQSLSSLIILFFKKIKNDVCCYSAGLMPWRVSDILSKATPGQDLVIKVRLD